MQFFLLDDLPKRRDRSTYSGKKPRRANYKLIILALQHDGGLAGRQCGAALNRIGFTLEPDLLPRLEPIELQVIRLRIDLFHNKIVSYHILDKTLNLAAKSRAGALP